MKKNDFALVRKPSSAVEKAAPSAKRILSGMVADTLALLSARVAETEGWFKKGNSCYYDSENYIEAVIWYRKAAERGHAEAQLNLGDCFVGGKGVAEDYEQATHWYRKAAEQGDSSAQHNLCIMYYNGEGVEKDYMEAVKWCRKLAEQGYDYGQNYLGNCYEKGHGVPQDYAQAVHWYQKAAEQGHESAQENLGACYANGRAAIAIENAVDTYKYVKLAETKGYEGAAKTVDAISELLSPEELREAERRYQELKSGLPEMRKRNEGAEAIYRNYRTNKALKKYDDARRLLRQAAEMGHTKAMYDCGIDYMSGDGFPQDNEQAYHWLREAAERGHADAQCFMGIAYERGRIEPPRLFSQDFSEAYKWFKLAAENDSFGKHLLTRVSSGMTSIQLQEGERRYREFQSSKK